jgi:hypothetical protein
VRFFRNKSKGGNLNFWKNWLIIIGISLIAMGLYVALFNSTPAFMLFGNLIDQIFWQDNTIIDGTRNFKGFMYSFSGTYVLLWGVNFLFISKYALIQGNKWAWMCLAISTIVWFTIMVPFSIYYRVYSNAIGDIIFFILIAIPIIKIKKYI